MRNPSDPAIAPAAAVRAARRALRAVPALRAHAVRAGVDPERVRRLEELPFTDKRAVFGSGDLGGWLDGGDLGAAAEVLTSSGRGGRFSVGVSSRREQAEQGRAVDAALRAVGAGDGDRTLLVNCLPMGIGAATRLATVATPSVHLEMALEVLVRLGPSFARTVVAAEPLFLKELAEAGAAAHGPGFAPHVTACFVGGEWVAAALRERIEALIGVASPPAGAGVVISMGAAELGLHVFAETPALRADRAGLGPDERRIRLGEDPGYSPCLLAYDPGRLHVEERRHPDGARTLAVTTLRPRLLPLVRYDLGDLGRRLGADPVVAVWGRRGEELIGPGWRARPEAVKERLFADARHAAALTGRFALARRGAGPALHVQLRQAARAGPPLRRFLAEVLACATGVDGHVEAHRWGRFPFHAAGDFQHKARYLAPAA